MSKQIISFNELRQLIGNKSRVTIWRWEKQNLFPKRVVFGPNSVGWHLNEIEQWIESKSAHALPSTKSTAKRNLKR